MPFDGAVDRLKQARPRMRCGVIGRAGRRSQLRHHFELYEAVLRLPLVVSLVLLIGVMLLVTGRPG